jgi:DNA-directed RNA polymerase specialized sigma subunit
MENSEIKEVERKKRSLKRYKKTLACIDRLEVKLDLVNQRLTSVRSPNLSGMPRGGTPVTSADLIADKIELEERIERLKERGVRQRREILEEIDSLEDPKHAEVLELFFINCLTLEEIADKLRYSDRHVYRIYSEGVTFLSENSQ